MLYAQLNISFKNAVQTLPLDEHLMNQVYWLYHTARSEFDLYCLTSKLF